jgi:hypothetical protein
MNPKEPMFERVHFTDLNLKYCSENDPEFIWADGFDKIADRLLKLRELIVYEGIGEVQDKLDVILDDMGVIYDK